MSTPVFDKIRTTTPHVSEWKRAESVRFCSSTSTAIDLSYQTIGDPSHPAIIVVMGLNNQATVWDLEMLQMLAVSGPFFVIRFDNRECGLSTKFDHMPCPSSLWYSILPPSASTTDDDEKFFFSSPKPLFSLKDMTEDAVALLDYLNVKEPAHWIGFSMGGAIAQLAAIHFPERVASMVLLSSTSGCRSLPLPDLKVLLTAFLRPCPKKKSKKSTSTSRSDDSSGSGNCSVDASKIIIDDEEDEEQRYIEELSEYRYQLAKECAVKDTPTDLVWLRRRIAETMKRSTYDGCERQLGAMLSSPSREEQLKNINNGNNDSSSKKHIPTTIIHGTKDLILPPVHGIRLASLIQGSKLHLWDDLGHGWSPFHFERFVKTFVSTISRSRSISDDDYNSRSGPESKSAKSKSPSSSSSQSSPTSCFVVPTLLSGAWRKTLEFLPPSDEDRSAVPLPYSPPPSSQIVSSSNKTPPTFLEKVEEVVEKEEEAAASTGILLSDLDDLHDQKCLDCEPSSPVHRA